MPSGHSEGAASGGWGAGEFRPGKTRSGPVAELADGAIDESSVPCRGAGKIDASPPACGGAASPLEETSPTTKTKRPPLIKPHDVARSMFRPLPGLLSRNSHKQFGSQDEIAGLRLRFPQKRAARGRAATRGRVAPRCTNGSPRNHVRS